MGRYSYIKYKRNKGISLFLEKFRDASSKAKKEKSVENYSEFIFFILLYPLMLVVTPFMLIYFHFQDYEYSLGYLEYQIQRNNLTDPQQIRKFLTEKEQEYKKRKLNGTISYSDRKHLNIKETFEYLFDKYPIEKTADKYHKEVITELSDIKRITLTTNEQVEIISPQINAIYSFSENKRLVEEKEENEREEKRLIQENRIQLNKERAKGRNLESFASCLSENQIKKLVQCCNEIPIFKGDTNVSEMIDILSCTHTQPLQVNNNKHISLLFSSLAKNKLICTTWMSVADHYQCFSSKNGKIIHYKDLSTALSTASLIKPEVDEAILQCVSEITETKE